ncbi:hypothetical protein LUZ61_004498 [Rhynchospora tenuis]|uniref:Dirigent protein n=1 Tax=Rhynchospora tenuis TaxID=198213 RepID=A0AAD5ZMY3_9POAL|nr:hypothetical protein LUZ61_004498 [Rhynchospora tenuis]
MASKLAPNSFIVLSFFLFLMCITSTESQHIHFFFHDIVTGSNPTVATITPAQKGPPTLFGKTSMMDDKLTEGPDPSSREVGRAQGFYASASLSELGLIQAMNLVFTDGAYKGSALTVLGRNLPGQTTSEMPVIGGTGQFRFARGYAIAKNYKLDYSTGNAIIEYDVYVRS